MEVYFKDFIGSVAILGIDVISYYSMKKNYELKKVPKEGQMKIGKRLFERFKAITEKYNDNAEYYDYVEYFDNVVNYCFPSGLLENYRRNLSTLIINKLHFQLGDFLRVGRFGGRYCADDNSIQIDADERNNKTIFHELFHLASSDRINNNVGLTFNRRKGRALNEGYTDVLTERYFGNVGYKKSYINESVYASLLEQIVGKMFMERCFLMADAKSLFIELEKYDSLDNILCFINGIDNIATYEPLDLKKQSYSNMAYYLINSYIRKKVINGENIFDPVVKDDVLRFVYQIPGQVTFDGQEIIIDLAKITNEIVDRITLESKFVRY